VEKKRITRGGGFQGKSSAGGVTLHVERGREGHATTGENGRTGRKIGRGRKEIGVEEKTKSGGVRLKRRPCSQKTRVRQEFKKFYSGDSDGDIPDKNRESRQPGKKGIEKKRKKKNSDRRELPARPTERGGFRALRRAKRGPIS